MVKTIKYRGANIRWMRSGLLAFPSVAFRHQSGRSPSFTGLRDHTLRTSHNTWKSSGPVITPTQRSLPDNTHTTEKFQCPSCRIRTRNPNRRAAEDTRLNRAAMESALLE